MRENAQEAIVALVAVSLSWMDGWMLICMVWLAYYLSYVEVWEQGMVHVMLVPWVTS